MPSHYRQAGLGVGTLNLHHPGPFSFTKGSALQQQSVYDMHRAYQADSCTSAFHPAKDDSSPTVSPSSTLQLQHPPGSSRTGLPANVEEVDVETILQLGELQDWAWPTAMVDAQDVKPTNISGISELSSPPFSSQSLQMSSTIINPSGLHDDQKGSSTSSLFTPGLSEVSHCPQQQSFDLQSWCSGVRNLQSPYIAIPKLLSATNGAFPTSSEPSPTTYTSPLRVDTRDVRRSPSTTPLSQARYSSNADQQHADKALGVQKMWQGKRAVTQRESHIWSERQRRKGMNHLFSTLRSLLPQPTSKTDKSTVVSEIIKYIQGLQMKLDELNRRRVDILRRKPMEVTASRTSSATTQKHQGANCSITSSSMPVAVVNEGCLQSFVMPNVALHISGSNAFITMSSLKKRGIFSRILLIMESHKLDVINAHISTSSRTVFHCLHVLAPQNDGEFPKEALQTALQSLTLPESSTQL